MIKHTIALFLVVFTCVVSAQTLDVPDANFKNYLLGDTTINTNKDAFIQLAEAQLITHLNINDKNINDLTGIESFIALTTLSCRGNHISSIALVNNVKLDSLNCGNNPITSIDVSENVALSYLNCDSASSSTICINSKQQQLISDYPENWIKDNTCNWSSLYCLDESSNCFALYYTTFDSLNNTFTFTVWVDSLTVLKAKKYRWDFGDGTFMITANPRHWFAVDTIYNVCMKVYTNDNDSCEYCHHFGKVGLYGTPLRHSVGGFMMQVVRIGEPTSIVSLSSATDTYGLRPNPAENTLHLSFTDDLSNVSIRIINSMGEAVQEEKELSGNLIDIDLTGLLKGLYILEVNENGVYTHRKFVKQ